MPYRNHDQDALGCSVPRFFGSGLYFGPKKYDHGKSSPGLPGVRVRRSPTQPFQAVSRSVYGQSQGRTPAVGIGLGRNPLSSERKNTRCPFCQAQYRVPSEFLNKRATCKSCGAAFKISFDQEDPASPETSISPNPSPASPGNQTEASTAPPEDPDLVLGKLGVKFGLLTEDQLKKLMARYRERGGAAGDVTLGELILEQEWMTRDQLDYLLKVRTMWTTRNLDKQFGEMIVGRDWATREEVADALKEQARMFTGSKTIFPIGELLMQGGVISEEQRSAILKIQDRLNELPDYQGAARVELDSASKTPLSDEALELTVSPDGLEAFVKVLAFPPDGLKPGPLRAYLDSNEIKFGIFDSSRLAALIQELDGDERPFKVAQGLPPEPPVDEKIEFFFDTDPFRIGTVKEGGEIDFKDRGDIPQVSQGDLLAKKNPGKGGRARDRRIRKGYSGNQTQIRSTGGRIRGAYLQGRNRGLCPGGRPPRAGFG